jgi:hypothetical protein
VSAVNNAVREAIGFLHQARGLLRPKRIDERTPPSLDPLDPNLVVFVRLVEPYVTGALGVLEYAIDKELRGEGAGIPMLLTCPSCGERHIDVGEFATKVHHTHACQACGMVWRPAIVPTVGVQFLPGFKNEVPQ